MYLTFLTFVCCLAGLPSHRDRWRESREGVAARFAKSGGVNCGSSFALRTMPKVKATSSDKVRCACGCGRILSRRQQSRHLQGDGPVTAVAGVLESRVYFREESAQHSESPPPQKRRRLQTPEPVDGEFCRTTIEKDTHLQSSARLSITGSLTYTRRNFCSKFLKHESSHSSCCTRSTLCSLDGVRGLPLSGRGRSRGSGRPS